MKHYKLLMASLLLAIGGVVLWHKLGKITLPK